MNVWIALNRLSACATTCCRATVGFWFTETPGGHHEPSATSVWPFPRAVPNRHQVRRIRGRCTRRGAHEVARA